MCAGSSNIRGSNNLHRSLAETWESTTHAAMSTYRTRLSSISLFVLLDLLGAAKPKVPSYFKTTHWTYQGLASLEQRLLGLEVLQSSGHPFLPEAFKDPHNFHAAWGVQDDHLPFMARGVEVLHLIPSPFPRVWHKIEDDGEHLDSGTVEDWAKMVTAFIGEWMELEGYFPSQPLAKNKRESTSKTEL
jgi:glutaminyl-peptide cyclotransferase